VADSALGGTSGDAEVHPAADEDSSRSVLEQNQEVTLEDRLDLAQDSVNVIFGMQHLGSVIDSVLRGGVPFVRSGRRRRRAHGANAGAPTPATEHHLGTATIRSQFHLRIQTG
jgi:hypothetical protein